ncbi:MAG: sensor histidine kinase [Acidimicrobiales bacterium]
MTDRSLRATRFSRFAAPNAGSANRLFGTPLTVIRLLMMAGLAWGTLASSHETGIDRRVALVALVVLALAAYLGWSSQRSAPSDTAATVFLGLLAIGGGALGAFSGVGIAFSAVLGIAAGERLRSEVTLGLLALALASLAVAVTAVGASYELIGWAVLSGAGGALAGLNRRQYRLRAEQSEELLLERERTATESAHAAALAERNRIAREVHDVLAHSLGALAVQLEVLDALLGDGDIERAKTTVATSRRLAVEGLAETRRAVHALRDAPLDLAERVAALADGDSAAFSVEGTDRPLPADAALALYRAAQEAISNARKHAPGAAVSIVLSFASDRTSIEIVDEYGPGVVPAVGAGTGSPGYGLAGMRERVELLGGSLAAGPLPPGGPAGWSVRVDLPVGAGTGGPATVAGRPGSNGSAPE